MSIEPIKASTNVKVPQSKAHQVFGKGEKTEAKKDGNNLLYGSLAALAVIGAGYGIYRVKGKPESTEKLAEKLKKWGLV